MKAKTKIRLAPEFKMPADATHAACVCIYNREERMPHTKIPLSEREFAALWRKSIQPGALPLGEFIAAAIREKSDSAERWQVENDFEESARKAVCLIDLLVSKAIADADTKTDPSSRRYDVRTSQLVSGLQDLAHEVTTGLVAGLCGTSKAGTEVTA